MQTVKQKLKCHRTSDEECLPYTIMKGQQGFFADLDSEFLAISRDNGHVIGRNCVSHCRGWQVLQQPCWYLVLWWYCLENCGHSCHPDGDYHALHFWQLLFDSSHCLCRLSPIGRGPCGGSREPKTLNGLRLLWTSWGVHHNTTVAIYSIKGVFSGF